MATLVKFLYNKDNNDLFAFFPQLNYNKDLYGLGMKTCYTHVGQHSSCSIEYAKASIKATPEQYKDLLNELVSIGYDLKVCK